MGAVNIRVAVDAMGGDNAPGAIVAGAVQALAIDPEIEVLLVGREADVLRELGGGASSRVSVVNADEVVGMDEHPANAVRSKRDSSMNVAARLVAEGKADAFVSAGNSGGIMAAAIFTIKRLPGVERPAIGTPVPARTGNFLLVDSGANTEVKPEYMYQFALLGDAYARRVLGVADPRVALLSNGEEENKGDELTIQAHRLLKTGPINFIGNIEGKALFEPTADVVVTDGFTGNLVLKTIEGAAAFLQDAIRSEAMKTPLGIAGGLLLKPTIGRIKERTDWRKVGGAPLLGVNGVVIIGHGRSDAEAARHMVLRGAESVRLGLVDAVRAAFADAAAPAPEPAPTAPAPGPAPAAPEAVAP